MDVMMAMVSGPPKRTALDGRRAQDGEGQLRATAGLEGLVREVTMIEAGDREHAHEVQRNGNPYGRRAPSHPEDGQTGQVHQDERNHTQPVDLCRIARAGLPVDRAAVEPTSHGTGYGSQMLIHPSHCHCCGTRLIRLVS